MHDDWTIWHHAPPHVFVPGSLYFVTAGTLYKQHFFRRTSHLEILQSCLFGGVRQFGWELRAWALLSNHYHLILKAPDDARSLKVMLQKLHSDSARRINKLDGAKGRRVWFEYRDTCLTFERSYLARLKYVMRNPVHHQLVKDARDYPYCSASWFARNAGKSFQQVVEEMPINEVKVEDEYEVTWERGDGA